MFHMIDNMQQIINETGPFLRNEIVYLIHQSAKDYLISEVIEESGFNNHLQYLHLFDRYLKALAESKYLVSRFIPNQQVKPSRSVPLTPIRYCSIHGFITYSCSLTLQMINDLSHVKLIVNFTCCPCMYTANCTRFALLLIDSKVTILDMRRDFKKHMEQMLMHILDLAL